ncbi:MAG: hypothetical protein V1895_03960 [Parcubacteria group bacterium]
MTIPQPTPYSPYSSNLYSLPGQQNAAAGTPQHVAPPPKTRTNWLMALVLFLVGLLGGGAAGYFLGDFLIFQPKLDQTEADKAQLESRVAALETEITQLQQGTTPTTPSTSGTTPGSGTAPTVSGVTPDPQTAGWSTFTSPEFHFSFKYPSDYQVRTFQSKSDLVQLNDNDVIFAAGLYKTGEQEAAGIVYVYKSASAQGLDQRSLALFKWPAHLPSAVQTEAAGAGQVNLVEEQTLTVNGTEGMQLTAYEGRELEKDPAGSTYKGYLFEEQFNQSYLVSQCDSDQSTQRNIVGCLFLTTFTITR